MTALMVPPMLERELDRDLRADLDRELDRDLHSLADPGVLRSSLLHGLPLGVAAELAGRFESSEHIRGSVLFTQGEPARSLFVVLTGRIKVSYRDPNGREHLLALAGPGDHFGELALLEGAPLDATATVVEHATVARVAQADWERWLARHPQVLRQVLATTAARLRRHRCEQAELAMLDVGARLVRSLLTLADQFGVPVGRELCVMHGLNQKELAQLVGASRETVNKLLRNFAARGWIRVEGHGFVVLDRARLERRAR